MDEVESSEKTEVEPLGVTEGVTRAETIEVSVAGP